MMDLSSSVVQKIPDIAWSPSYLPCPGWNDQHTIANGAVDPKDLPVLKPGVKFECATCQGTLVIEDDKKNLKRLKKVLKPPGWGRTFGHLPNRCVYDGFECTEGVSVLYEQFEVGSMIGYHPQRFGTWGDRLAGTLCPSHARLEKKKNELEEKIRVQKKQSKVFLGGWFAGLFGLRGRISRKLKMSLSSIIYQKPKKLPFEEKYSPFIAQMKEDGATVLNYFPPVDVKCPNCGTTVQSPDKSDICMVIADRRMLVNVPSSQQVVQIQQGGEQVGTVR